MKEPAQAVLRELDRGEMLEAVGGEDSFGGFVGRVVGSVVGAVVWLITEDQPEASYAYCKVGYSS